MRKLILMFVLVSGFAFGQFEITDNSSDWEKVGKVEAAEITKKDDVMKIRFIDYQSRVHALGNPFSSFQTPYQNGVDKIEKAIEKGNKGIKDGFYEFSFKYNSDTLDKVYETIISHFDSKVTEELTLSFPEGNLYLNFIKSFGIYMFSFGMDGDNKKIYSTPMNKKQVTKLFNKSK